jgi:hypothetical protein
VVLIHVHLTVGTANISAIPVECFSSAGNFSSCRFVRATVASLPAAALSDDWAAQLGSATEQLNLDCKMSDQDLIDAAKAAFNNQPLSHCADKSPGNTQEPR